MFAFYASYGYLDMACPSALPLGVIKDFMSYPVSIPLRPKMKSNIQVAWDELTLERRVKEGISSTAGGKSREGLVHPDEALVTIKAFQRLIHSPLFERYLTEYTPFGKRGEGVIYYCRLDLIALTVPNIHW